MAGALFILFLLFVLFKQKLKRSGITSSYTSARVSSLLFPHLCQGELPLYFYPSARVSSLSLYSSAREN